jgi:hypothetical protein
MPVNEEAPLSFSVDTLFFDTVFTTKGSATRLFKIYNESSEDLETTLVYERPGFFRFNVDGQPTDGNTSVMVPSKDSIYIFAEVTIDPDNPLSVSPFVIEEQIQFRTLNALQEVNLVAWGQNANYITNENRKGNISLLSCNFQEIALDDPKPYVVYGILVVDSCTLRLPAGCQLYVHGGVVNNNLGTYNDGLIFFGVNGTLISEGTAEDPVIIQGDRLESTFDEVPGQWSGLRFGAASGPHQVKHTIVKNAINGMVLDSASEMVLQQSQIVNNSGTGIVARHARLNASNSLVVNGGLHPVQLTFGGEYSFTYCTLVNYGLVSESLYANNITCYNQDCSENATNPLFLTVQNSIIMGSTADQIGLLDATEQPGDFNLSLSHNLVRVEDLLDNYPDFFSICDPCWNYDFRQTMFQNPSEQDFMLDSLSQAAGKALYLSSFPLDASAKMRSTTEPDLGCFERLEP